MISNFVTGVEKGGTGIEQGGTGIEKGGTGIEKGGTGIEHGGTGVEKGGTGIEKGGTGIRAWRRAALGMLVLLFSSALYAAPGGTWEDWGDMGGVLQFGVQNKTTLTLSWSTFDASGNPIVLIGAGQLSKDTLTIPLFKLTTGFQVPGKPLPMLVKWGRMNLSFDGCGNALGQVSRLKAESAGTGKAESAGTGKAESAGTGKAESAGTGKAESAGTGKAESAGTGKAESAGTGKAESAGTGKFIHAGNVILVGPKAGACN